MTDPEPEPEPTYSATIRLLDGNGRNVTRIHNELQRAKTRGVSFDGGFYEFTPARFLRRASLTLLNVRVTGPFDEIEALRAFLTRMARL